MKIPSRANMALIPSERARERPSAVPPPVPREADLRREWDESEFQKKLEWEKAKPAARDAWHRVDENYTSYSSDTAKQQPPKKG
jgi:hypothetical protein